MPKPFSTLFLYAVLNGLTLSTFSSLSAQNAPSQLSPPTSEGREEIAFNGDSHFHYGYSPYNYGYPEVYSNYNYHGNVSYGNSAPAPQHSYSISSYPDYAMYYPQQGINTGYGANSYADSVYYRWGYHGSADPNAGFETAPRIPANIGYPNYSSNYYGTPYFNYPNTGFYNTPGMGMYAAYRANTLNLANPYARTLNYPYRASTPYYGNAASTNLTSPYYGVTTYGINPFGTNSYYGAYSPYYGNTAAANLTSPYYGVTNYGVNPYYTTYGTTGLTTYSNPYTYNSAYPGVSTYSSAAIPTNNYYPSTPYFNASYYNTTPTTPYYASPQVIPGSISY